MVKEQASLYSHLPSLVKSAKRGSGVLRMLVVIRRIDCLLFKESERSVESISCLKKVKNLTYKYLTV